MRVLSLAAVLLVGFSLLPPSIFAGEAPDKPTEAALFGSFSALSVRDLEASVSWYEEMLGFRLESRSANDEREAALMSRVDSLIELAQFAEAKTPTAAHQYLEYGIFKLGFKTKDIEALFSRLESNGVDVFFPIVDIPNDRKTFGIRDPDGNILQFFGD